MKLFLLKTRYWDDKYHVVKPMFSDRNGFMKQMKLDGSTYAS